MKLFEHAKDGGPESPVDGFFVVEFKNLFSIVILKFNKGRRETYHSHAFNALTWFICGDMVEELVDGEERRYARTLRPKYTPKHTVHRVRANKTSWAISLRGPWQQMWIEYSDQSRVCTVLTHGRKQVMKLKRPS